MQSTAAVLVRNMLACAGREAHYVEGGWLHARCMGAIVAESTGAQSRAAANSLCVVLQVASGGEGLPSMGSPRAEARGSIAAVWGASWPVAALSLGVARQPENVARPIPLPLPSPVHACRTPVAGSGHPMQKHTDLPVEKLVHGAVRMVGWALSRFGEMITSGRRASSQV